VNPLLLLLLLNRDNGRKYETPNSVSDSKSQHQKSEGVMHRKLPVVGVEAAATHNSKHKQ
jgi:hypothetical protein